MRNFLAYMFMLLLVSPIPAVAEKDAFNAGWLRYACGSKHDSISYVHCLIFIRAFRDGLFVGSTELLMKIGELEKKAFKTSYIESGKFSFSCVPDGVGPGQLAEMFVKYMRDRPEVLHRSASIQLKTMMNEHFPCKSK